MSQIRPRPQPTLSGDHLPTRRVSDEGKQRLSELARKRHQDGGFERTPGRPKRKPLRRRIAEMVAQAALEEQTAQSIIDVFKDGIAAHQPIQIRLKAAEAWLKIDQEETKLEQRKEKDETEAFDREAALTILARGLSEGHAATLLRKQMSNGSDYIDGHAVDVQD